MQECDELYFSNDIPCIYNINKNTIVTLYPIKVKDWGVFEKSFDLISYKKNEIPDVEIIQMSYLEFLYQVIIIGNAFNNGEYVNMALGNFIHYVLHEEECSVRCVNNVWEIVILDGKTVKYSISSKEFEQLMKVVMYQNIFEYDDREISADVRDLYNTYVKATNANYRHPSLEEQKTYVMANSGYSMSDINEMSYRVFTQIFNHDVNIVNYISDKIIQASSKYQVDEDIIHPCYAKKKDKYAVLFTDASTLAKKGIDGASQLANLNNIE